MAVWLLLALPSLLAAQSSPKLPPVSVSAGAALLSESEGLTRNARPGWMADLAIPVSGLVSLVGEVDRFGWSQPYTSSSGRLRFDYSLYTVGGGLRAGPGRGNNILYFQLLAGLRRYKHTVVDLDDNSSSSFSPRRLMVFQPGIGLSIRRGRALFRLQGDWRLAPFNTRVVGSHDTARDVLHDFRLAGAVGFSFPRK
jgi:hypothetical protein